MYSPAKDFDDGLRADVRGKNSLYSEKRIPQIVA